MSTSPLLLKLSACDGATMVIEHKNCFNCFHTQVAFHFVLLSPPVSTIVFVLLVLIWVWGLIDI